MIDRSYNCGTRDLAFVLPNSESAWIPPEKITEYLLSGTHPVGSSKARFFRRHGYGLASPETLEKDLLAVVSTGRVVSSAHSPHGDKYVIDGMLSTPKGTTVAVRTVWIVEMDCCPRLVTAYPA